MSEYTAEQAEHRANHFENAGILDIAAMLRAYAATLRQQATNAPEIGSKLVDQQAERGDGAVSDEVRLFSGDLDVLANLVFPKTAERIRAVLYRDVAPLLRAPAEQGGRVDGQWRKGDCFIESDADHWEAGIDQHGVPRNQSTDGVWHHRVVCYGPTEAEAASLRDQVLTALAQNAQGDAPVDKRATGVYHKYNVTRTDGSDQLGGKHHDCEYFVLDLTHDPFAKPAATAYADACEAEYPMLAADMRNRYGLHAERARVPDGMTYQVRAVSDRPLGDAGWMVIDRDGMFKHPQQFDYRALAAPSQTEESK